MKNGKDRIILGENAVFSMDCEKTGLNNNVLVVGTSGGGKTMSVIEPRLLTAYQSSLIVTVTKRRLVNKYRSLFEKRGYVVKDLNFVNPERSDCAYDPLRYIRNESDITNLAAAIVMADPRKNDSRADPYWDQAGISLLSAEIALTLMSRENPCLADVLSMHAKMEPHESGEGIKIVMGEDLKVPFRREFLEFSRNRLKSYCTLPSKTAKCVYGTLNVCLDTIFTDEMCRMFRNQNKINFEQLATQRTVLFVSTSAVNPVLHNFINVFYGQVFKSLFEYAEELPGGKLPIPVQVLCDDFATGSRIRNFPEYISILREKQISVMLLVQSESQLAGMYGPNDATTIINNCDTYLYMGGMDLNTGRSISQRLNAPLDEVLYMPVGQEYIFRRGQKPIVTSRYNILENEKYREITEEYENIR